MDIDKKEIGKRIKSIRLNLGETSEKFGERFSPIANRGLVSGWENGRYLPNPERLKAIATIGNMSVNELLYGDKFNYVENVLKENQIEIEDDFLLYISDYDIVFDFVNLTEDEILKIYEDFKSGAKLDELNLGAHLYLAASEVDNENINAASKYYKQRFNKSTEEAYNEVNNIKPNKT